MEIKVTVHVEGLRELASAIELLAGNSAPRIADYGVGGVSPFPRPSETPSKRNAVVAKPEAGLADAEPVEKPAKKPRDPIARIAKEVEAEAEATANLEYVRDVQKPTLDLAATKGRAVVTSLLAEFSVASAKDLPRRDWPAYIERLNELKG